MLHKKAIVNSLISVAVFIVILISVIILAKGSIREYYDYTDQCDLTYGNSSWHFESIDADDSFTLGWNYKCTEGKKNLLKWNKNQT